MTVWRAADVERLRLRELLRVSIGSDQRNEDHLPFADKLSADLQVLARGAIDHLQRTFEAENLIDRRSAQTLIITQARGLLRMAQDCEDSGGDQLHGREVAREHQKNASGHELLIA